MQKKTTLYLDPHVKYVTDSFLAKIRLSKNITFSDYAELAIRIMNAIFQDGRIPDDLGLILQRYDAKALAELQSLLQAMKVITEQPSFEVV